MKTTTLPKQMSTSATWIDKVGMGSCSHSHHDAQKKTATRAYASCPLPHKFQQRVCTARFPFQTSLRHSLPDLAQNSAPRPVDRLGARKPSATHDGQVILRATHMIHSHQRCTAHSLRPVSLGTLIDSIQGPPLALGPLYLCPPFLFSFRQQKIPNKKTTAAIQTIGEHQTNAARNMQSLA